jgi:transcriptional regulator NrdR family protein
MACGNEISRVTETRLSPGTGRLRRRRACPTCGARWTTDEVRREPARQTLPASPLILEMMLHDLGPT